MIFFITLFIIFFVGYFIVKKFYPQGVLFVAGFLLLCTAILLKDTPILNEKASIGSNFLDIFQYLKDTFSKTTAGLGLTIMVVGGFAKYMDHIGASKALVKITTKPMKKLNSPYLVLALTYILGQILNIFIPSASGLGVLLMVTVYPILVSLGASPLSATAVIGTTACLDLGPASGNSVLAAKTANLDAALYFVKYQLPVAIFVIIAIAITHYFVQKIGDKNSTYDDFGVKTKSSIDEEDSNVPNFYAIFPIIPLVVILAFSSLFKSSIKMNVEVAMLLSVTVSMVIEGIRKKTFKNTISELKIIFNSMGSQFAAVITLIVAGQFFAYGLTKVGVINSIIDWTKNAGLGVQPMILVMTAVISASSVIMGSGNAPFFAFAALAPTVAASVNIDPVVIAMPMQLASGIARSVSPITAVIVAVCGISGVSPFLVVRRTFLPMLVGLVVLLISNMVLFG
ncbi:transporter, anaerobic C4-dicarboxylate uptake C family [Cetobacterium somerae ATCC BAA-474]|uniref:Transporter, anaerobic C4-dicarboxylate uptake C family n=1 Tax=Cetobacterium somerae ATCC BAA-474 TaxID=1319815 RepID=U7VE41_9FUSO|nr:C4-dicarboxylate transporter DcuC [Cetobacterium somerae]ERT69780.1 transporter, anaerobic C4-dicarboxylate uptake C family [Cetobacterium somerae ATCC BAA-474]